MLLKEKLFQNSIFNMMGHDAARICTARNAEECRAAPSPIQNKTNIIVHYH